MIPWAQFMDSLMNDVKKMLKNPWTTVITVVLNWCSTLSKKNSFGLGSICRAAVSIRSTIAGYNSLTTFNREWKGLMGKNAGVCDLIE